MFSAVEGLVDEAIMLYLNVRARHCVKATCKEGQQLYDTDMQHRMRGVLYGWRDRTLLSRFPRVLHRHQIVPQVVPPLWYLQYIRGLEIGQAVLARFYRHLSLTDSDAFDPHVSQLSERPASLCTTEEYVRVNLEFRSYYTVEQCVNSILRKVRAQECLSDAKWEVILSHNVTLPQLLIELFSEADLILYGH
eukprot:10323-Heterococcus_DN1.PRE.9